MLFASFVLFDPGAQTWLLEKVHELPRWPVHPPRVANTMPYMQECSVAVPDTHLTLSTFFLVVLSAFGIFVLFVLLKLCFICV